MLIIQHKNYTTIKIEFNCEKIETLPPTIYDHYKYYTKLKLSRVRINLEALIFYSLSQQQLTRCYCGSSGAAALIIQTTARAAFKRNFPRDSSFSRSRALQIARH